MFFMLYLNYLQTNLRYLFSIPLHILKFENEFARYVDLVLQIVWFRILCTYKFQKLSLETHFILFRYLAFTYLLLRSMGILLASLQLNPWMHIYFLQDFVKIGFKSFIFSFIILCFFIFKYFFYLE